MATSGTDTFSLNKNQLITLVYRRLNIIDENSNPSPKQITEATTLLNLMLKGMQIEGIQLWNRLQGTLFLQKAQNTYEIGRTGEHCTDSYITTELSGDEALGQTTLSVTTTTDMTVGDYVGIELDDDTRQWTTLSSKTSTTITVADALTSAASEGNSVVTYTTKTPRPLTILKGRRYYIPTASENNLYPAGYDEYFGLPLKTLAGTPNLFYYDKTITNGKMYVFPTPNNVKSIIKFTYEDPVDDMTNATDDFDFPHEWGETLYWNLCERLALTYDVPIEKRQEIKAKASELFLKLKEFNTDDSPLYISCSKGRARRRR